VDVYLIHGIGPGSWEEARDRKIPEEYEQFRREGMIRSIGFSYHGNFEHFKQVVNARDWDMCQVQQNLLDREREVTDQVYEFIGENSVALVIMEPLRGGGLANAPAKVQEIYDTYPIKHTPAEWAFRYLISRPEVSAILSGMTTLEQLKENIAIFSKPDAIPRCMSGQENELLKQVKSAYDSIVSIPCTACNYCMPCPSGVRIPHIFSLFNDGSRLEYFATQRRRYMFLTQGGGDFTKCAGCGTCGPKCPQGIDVPSQLKNAHETLKGWTEVAG
jgi:predicted aldo/keto reductase-like oxidoreductase